ncbi:MAG TPA: hypothetical protein VET89_06345 [Stellaceae bacterium]|jgi:hypothetical protein|nr:hypothetical protein [Stellaceae bacterium]
MEKEPIYRLSAKPHPSGGFQLHAEAVDPGLVPENYPPYWVCSHGEGEFHASYEDAINCPQYWALLGQIT